MIVQRRDGSLWLWVRTRYGIGHSCSTDEGRTWSDVTPSALAHPAARFFVRRLQSGNLLLVKHGPLQQRTGRSHLTAYLSKDDGSTWQGGLLLDERPSVSYPDGCQQDDGRIVIIYDRERTDDKEILLATFTESDVLAGTNTSGQVRLRVLINRATGQNSRRTSQPKPNPPLRTHGDGAAPLFGLGAECRSLKSGEPVAKFVDGAKLFTDRDYHAENLPALLSGRTFVQASINGTKLEIVRPGVVFVVTPLPDRNRDSVAESLMKQGFAKVAIPEFRLFGTPANLCTMYQKQVAAGDVITLAKWGVLCY
jgi:hypothetical protein